MNISLPAEAIFHIGSFPVTNTLLMAWLVIGVLIIIALVISKRLSLVPRGLQNVFEAIFELWLKVMDDVTGDRKQSRRFFPLVLTIFLFVLFGNLIEIVPGLGTIGIWEMHNGNQILIPFIRSSSADLNTTIAIAVASILGVQIFGIFTLGVFRYAGKFFVAPWKKPYGIGTFVGILELIAECAKLISFSFRLFGNIFAGEVLLTVVLFLVPYIAPLPFLFLEIFVGLIQAVVFSMLTLVFLQMAVTAHDEHEIQSHN